MGSTLSLQDLPVGASVEIHDATCKYLCHVKQVWTSFYCVSNRENTITQFFPKSAISFDPATNLHWVDKNVDCPRYITAEQLKVGDAVEVRYRGSVRPYNARTIKVSMNWSAIAYAGNDVWYRNTSYKVDTMNGKLWVQYEDRKVLHVEPKSLEFSFGSFKKTRVSRRNSMSVHHRDKGDASQPGQAHQESHAPALLAMALRPEEPSTETS